MKYYKANSSLWLNIVCVCVGSVSFVLYIVEGTLGFMREAGRRVCVACGLCAWFIQTMHYWHNLHMITVVIVLCNMECDELCCKAH